MTKKNNAGELATEQYTKDTAAANGNPDAYPSGELIHVVTALMQAMRIPAHINGYHYLREAIVLAVDSRNDARGKYAKDLFPKVAKSFNTTTEKVERGIRYALNTAWNRCDFESLQKTYSVLIPFGYERPTNVEFIACVADYFRMLNRRPHGAAYDGAEQPSSLYQ